MTVAFHLKGVCTLSAFGSSQFFASLTVFVRSDSEENDRLSVLVYGWFGGAATFCVLDSGGLPLGPLDRAWS